MDEYGYHTDYQGEPHYPRGLLGKWIQDGFPAIRQQDFQQYTQSIRPHAIAGANAPVPDSLPMTALRDLVLGSQPKPQPMSNVENFSPIEYLAFLRKVI